MMTSFWILAAIMLFVAVSFVLRPWIRFENSQSQKGLTSDWYHARLKELKKERDSGLFSQQEFNDAVTELKLTATSELSELNEAKQKSTGLSNSNLWVLAASGLLILISSLFYLTTGQYQKLDNWQQTMMDMPSLSKKIIQDAEAKVTFEELQDFALGLRTKLVEKEEAIGWMLLGRTLMAMNDIDGAISAFEKSYDMQPKNASNAIGLAQALQQKGDEFDLNRSVRLLQEVMTYQPANEIAVLLFSEANLMLENYEVALKGFEYGLSMLTEEDPRRGAVQQRLGFIQEQTGTLSQSSLNIKVNLTAEIEFQLSQFKYLFVFAKNSQMPMPIAVKKIPVAGFPAQVSLTDADMMLPDLTLSSQKTVDLYARLSVDEDAPFVKGDWQGKVMQVNTSTKEVINMIINEEFK